MACIHSVMVNWNSRQDTTACVESLAAAGARLEEIVVVDNASSDGSVPALRERFGPALKLIEATENLGYAGGVNLGIDDALEAGADWVFLLNNDTKVARDIFTAFRQAMDAHTGFDLWAPVIFYEQPPDRIWHFGDRLLPGTLITTRPYRNRQLDSGLPQVLPVDFASGAGMLVSRRVFEAVGRFDRAFFMYGEEIDFCWRARQAGFHTAALRDARMWHRVSASARRVAPEMRYLKVRNQSWFYRRYAGALGLALLFVFSSLRGLALGLADLAKWQPKLTGPLFRGWYEGWFRPVPRPEI